jgi:hypothetical protein
MISFIVSFISSPAAKHRILLDRRDEGIDRCVDLRVPGGFSVHPGVNGLAQRGGPLFGERGQARFLVGKALVERPLRRPRIADDVGDLGSVQALLPDRLREPVKQPLSRGRTRPESLRRLDQRVDIELGASFFSRSPSSRLDP